MKTTTESDFQANLEEYIDLVVDENKTMMVSRDSDAGSGVIVMSLSEYNSFMESEHLLSSPTDRQALLRSSTKSSKEKRFK